MRMLAVIGTFFAVLAASCASAETDRLYTALDTYDAATLSHYAETEADAARAAVARGGLSAMLGDDDDALHGLSLAVRADALDPDLRRAAWSILSDIHLRNSRFSEVVDAIEAARAVADQTEPERFIERTDMNLAFARALSPVAPMRASVDATGSVAITHDLAGLPRANLTINGETLDAVIDTGAGFSAIAQSAADRLGLHMIEGEVTVGSSTADLAARLAVADEVTLAGGHYRDVVFIVVPDEAFSFAGGAYTITSIVGFPVLARLGRLEFVNDGDDHVLRHTAGPRSVSLNDATLFLEGLQPVTLVRAQGADRDLRMFVDTGAQSTSFTPAIVADARELLEEASQHVARTGGGGGVTEEEAMLIPALTLAIGETEISLTDVSVHGEEENGRHGVIGQNVLRHGSGYVIDFNTMQFEVLP